MCAFVLYLQAEERLHKSVLASFFTEFALPSAQPSRELSPFVRIGMWR